ncbi:unnamed protein product [Echinostoma caproni]|uniref:Movement protein n=1 Tax=Echinostoma caproni TaxID=27848 RepID=A0A183AGX2_9TREM|nr:unnamed protein product [Echinostoma caproni]
MYQSSEACLIGAENLAFCILIPPTLSGKKDIYFLRPVHSISLEKYDDPSLRANASHGVTRYKFKTTVVSKPSQLTPVKRLCITVPGQLTTGQL